jgi:1-acyl-sn-glycerol-3-phosphate acyltransferase
MAANTAPAAGLDQAWSRCLAARVVRELLIRGVFGAIIATYSRTEIIGREQLAAADGPVIFVANHCSHVDTPALLRSLPSRPRRRTAVAAASDYFYAGPLLAGAVSLAFGTVPVERRAGHAGISSTDAIERLLERGWNLVLFAEGTRSRDGRVGVLRSGAALLAARHDVPIVPVHISGTREAMPPGRKWMLRPRGAGRWARHTIRITFGAPIPVAPRQDRFEVMESVRLFMEGRGAATTPDPKLAARRAAARARSAGMASALPRREA